MAGPYYYDGYMAHLHKKIKKGRTYYYVRESTSVAGKTKIINQVYLGTAERIMQLALSAKQQGIFKVKSQTFGALWLSNLVEKDIDVVSMIDGIVGRATKEKGPTIGQYFLYAVMNRMVQPSSKSALPEWYAQSAIQFIRPVDISGLDSRHFWKKWDRVDESQTKRITEQFLKKINEIEPSGNDCFLFDTTNYYTYIAEHTSSVLAQRGKNKDGKDWLKQIGLALLVARDTRLPLFYREYEGNRHDSKVFLRVMDEVLSAGGRQQAVVVFDKGMNSEENIQKIDNRPNVHFITTYSPNYAKELTHISLENFRAVDTLKNRRLSEAGKADDRLLAWRCTKNLWGKQRSVIVTYNPLNAAKQRYRFEKKLLDLQSLLFTLRSKVRTWRKDVRKRAIKQYKAACEQLHLPENLYDLIFEQGNHRTSMGFRKNYYRIARYIDRFGKTIIVTDLFDWSVDEIVKASLDRYLVEQAFRQSKDHELVSITPIFHWTDGKIRCHLLTCIMALALLCLIEIRLKRAGLDMSAKEAMRHMRNLNSCLYFLKGKKKPLRMIEEPSDAQAEILKAFGYEVHSGVLSTTNT